MSFGHAGILYKQSFVMYDRKTESLWVHVTGKAEVGPRKGDQLAFIPSTVTTWAQWKASYPNTLVLPGYRRGGFMGTYRGVSSGRGLGLSVLVRFKAKLYPYAALKKNPLVNDQFNGEDVLVFYSEKAGTATAWGRELDGKSLKFQVSNRTDEQGNRLLRDEQTQSLWSWLTGKAVEGPMKGQLLKQLSYNPILNNRFKGFYPDGPIFGQR